MMEMRVSYDNDFYKVCITEHGYLGLKYFIYDKCNKLFDAPDEVYLFKKHKYGLESVEIKRDIQLVHGINTFYFNENNKLNEGIWYSGSISSLGHSVDMFYFPKNLDNTFDMEKICWANQLRYHEYSHDNTVLVRFPVLIPIDRNIQLIARHMLTGNCILTKSFIIMNPEFFKEIYEKTNISTVASIDVDKDEFFKLYEDMYNKIYDPI